MSYYRYVDKNDGWEWIADCEVHGRVHPVLSKCPVGDLNFRKTHPSAQFDISYFKDNCEQYPLDEALYAILFEALL